ncbi:VOC family protein [Phytoactinopolyspora endophytica]|uniref:VOC family protein n=1 Tax=Phytoactinopolyspora endophytica TaxID=1642495 RepID=UPI00101B676E|nr:VOC family protein [Phytoactinopolyspora endophytica]
MRTEIDHLVWGCPDLGLLVDRVTRLMGVAPRFGGRHEGRGTQNYLLALGHGRYLELLGPDPEQPEPAGPRPLGIDQTTEPGLIGWAIRTTAMGDLLRAARAEGYDPGEAVRMSRRTPAGTVLEWLLTPPGVGGVLPFVIDWLGSPHPAADLPSVELMSFTLHHPQPDDVRAALTAMNLDDEEVTVAFAADPGISATLATPQGDVTIQ